MPRAFHRPLRHIDSYLKRDVNFLPIVIASDYGKQHNMKNAGNFFTCSKFSCKQ